MSVDLPAPFSPQIAWISPSPTVRDTSFRATTPGKRLVMDRISRMFSATGTSFGQGVPTARRRAGTPPVVRCFSPASELAGLHLLRRVVAGVDHDLLVVALEHHLHLEQVGGDD